jgi:hypothetical protein
VSSHFSDRIPVAAFALAAALAVPAAAQYPGQVSTTASGPVLRAVSVYEWTGDEQHPKASRIIPISVYDGQQLQDGGIYMAQPEPLALESDVEYQLKQDGKNIGLLVVDTSALVQGSWVGNVTFKALPKPKPVVASAWKDEDDEADNDEPVLHRKHHAGDQSGSSTSGSGSGSGSQGPPPDPDRPTLHRSDDAGSGNSSTASNAPAPDPNRPTLHKSTDDSASSPTTVDPNHPQAQAKNEEDDSYVTSVSTDVDPNRPRMIAGPTSYSGPKMTPSVLGLPADMEQAVAVSDSRNLPEHIWSYSWANPADETKYKDDLEDQARAALGLTPPAPPKPAAKKNTGSHKTQLALPAEPAPLVDEHFHVFELAYGSGATMVFSARTAGTGADEKFVTLIAQPDLYGGLVVLVKNVTDAAHLDETPRMRLIDPVDAMADNRGELLFELRGATQRQFALYRVLRGQATQVFLSGTREIGAVSE